MSEYWDGPELEQFVEFPGIRIQLFIIYNHPWGYCISQTKGYTLSDMENIKPYFNGEFHWANWFRVIETHSGKFTMTQDRLHYVNQKTLKDCVEYLYNQRTDTAKVSNMIYGSIGIHP